MERKSYSPSGVRKSPTPVRLLPDEHANIDNLIKISGLRQSVVMREVVLAGLPIVQAKYSAGHDTESDCKE